MPSYLEELISSHELENPINKTIYQITSYIKKSHDYDYAIKMILENNLKLEDLVRGTVRLKFCDIVELADALIRFKNNKVN